MIECGFTQEKLARQINVNPSTLNRKINNIDGDILTVKEAKEISDILNINNPSEYFFSN